MLSWKQDVLLFTSDTWNTCVCWRINVLCHSHQLIYREKEVIAVIKTNAYVYTIPRHMKDQNKKVANLKHNQQMEKKKNAQLLEEVRRREDNMTDNSQHLQVSLFFNCVLKSLRKVHSVSLCVLQDVGSHKELMTFSFPTRGCTADFSHAHEIINI